MRTITLAAIVLTSLIGPSVAYSQSTNTAEHSPNAGPYAERIHVESVEIIYNDSLFVTPGQYSYFPLTLDAGVTLNARLQVVGGIDNMIDLHLVDLANFQLLKAGQPFKHFSEPSGAITANGQFTFVTPARNVYYLVLDNRGSLTRRQVELRLERSTNEPTEAARGVRAAYEQKYALLNELFEFPEFDIHIVSCGTPNAFSTPHIVMCRELIELLQAERVPEAEQFVFFHEAAHSLLNLWQYPLYDNEDAADEFATVMLLLLKQSNAALQAAHWWSEASSMAEVRAKLVTNDRHSLSPQRARNIVNWLNREDELTSRWARVMIPNFTTNVLELLAAEMQGRPLTSPDEATILRSLQDELSRRRP